MSVQAKLAALACACCVAPEAVRPTSPPTQAEIVRQTLRGIVRGRKHRTRQSAPVPPDICAAAVQACPPESLARQSLFVHCQAAEKLSRTGEIWFRKASRRHDSPVSASRFVGAAAVQPQTGTLNRVFQQPVIANVTPIPQPGEAETGRLRAGAMPGSSRRGVPGSSPGVGAAPSGRRSAPRTADGEEPRSPWRLSASPWPRPGPRRGRRRSRACSFGPDTLRRRKSESASGPAPP